MSGKAVLITSSADLTPAAIREKPFACRAGGSAPGPAARLDQRST